jgi:hypothetical protein
MAAIARHDLLVHGLVALDVRLWPKADILIAWGNVRFRG